MAENENMVNEAGAANDVKTEVKSEPAAAKEADRSENVLTEVDHYMIENMSDRDLKILARMLMDVRDNERREMQYAKKQSRFAMIISIVSLVVVILAMVAVVSVVPKVLNLIDNVNGIVTEAEVTLADASKVIDNLNLTTEELANQDIAGLFDKVDGLVVESQASINEAMDKVNQMDIETLNKAIQELHAVVEPMSRLFRR